jgi:hypothetical protein
MAHRWPIEYEGALYRVLLRGNEHWDIFLDDDDRWMFLTDLAEAREHFSPDVFGCALMGNHYHSSDRCDARAGQLSGEPQGLDLQNQTS